MKTVKIIKTEVNLFAAHSVSSGYGHKKIFVSLEMNGKYQDFNATTSNMPAYDDATELEGSEKELALYNIIASQIEDEVCEWLATL